jgi:hypothetical protein
MQKRPNIREVVHVTKVKNASPKKKISSYMITINTNKRDGNAEQLEAVADQIFSSEYFNDHFSDLIKLRSTEDYDSITDIQLEVGNVEYMETRANAPHIHIVLKIYHSTLLQLNYDYIRSQIIEKMGDTVYVHFKRHNDYSESMKNYVAKKA